MAFDLYANDQHMSIFESLGGNLPPRAISEVELSSGARASVPESTTRPSAESHDIDGFSSGNHDGVPRGHFSRSSAQHLYLNDFDFAARNYPSIRNYTWFRYGAAGEWSYRNNLEASQRCTFKQRALVDITKVKKTLSSQQTTQLYLDNNDTATKELIRRNEETGAKAIVFTIDAVAEGNRVRGRQFEPPSGSDDEELSLFGWDYYGKLASFTDLPAIIKGINSVEDAKLAVEHKVLAIIISNHGGRQVDGTEVFADGGVRYRTDVLKRLALGVKAVGLGRYFM
ncbi:hypothetical protein QQZ08_004068 [Neonectria magnoliae]|uniref:FMN hydroxy acid dehydrogenase domain-containing protein n=1 Tax=Neonectria magnoliae TaxID=2732573 RepID=A0ABR1I7I8_9HYPO